MASNTKIDRAVNGPGLIEITLGVLLSLTLGILLAALHLIFKPVEVVAKAPDDAVPGQVYFVEGAVNSSKARQWTRKRQMLADGASADVTFSEEELNAWMASVAPQPQKDAPPAGMFTPEKVNFRINDNVIQIGLLGKVTALDISREVVFQTRGKFVKADEGFTFVPDELYIGSLPVHAVQGLAPWFIKRMLASQELPEDLQKTWKQLQLVAVEGNLLRLTLP